MPGAGSQVHDPERAAAATAGLGQEVQDEPSLPVLCPGLGRVPARDLACLRRRRFPFDRGLLYHRRRGRRQRRRQPRRDHHRGRGCRPDLRHHSGSTLPGRQGPHRRHHRRGSGHLLHLRQGPGQPHPQRQLRGRAGDLRHHGDPDRERHHRARQHPGRQRRRPDLQLHPGRRLRARHDPGGRRRPGQRGQHLRLPAGAGGPQPERHLPPQFHLLDAGRLRCHPGHHGSGRPGHRVGRGPALQPPGRGGHQTGPQAGHLPHRPERPDLPERVRARWPGAAT